MRLLVILFVILHARIQSLKESWVVAAESFSIKLKEASYTGVLIKGVFEILKELTRKHTPKYNFR